MFVPRFLRHTSALLLVAATTSALAELPSAPITLSPEDREAALEAGAARAAKEPPINGLARGIHGEIGMEIGTGGRRALYGSTIIPLGENGMAQFSFMTGRTGSWRR